MKKDILAISNAANRNT